MYKSLQFSRAIAALLVVIAHNGALLRNTPELNFFVRFLPSFGSFGVVFFFVLSGFIIHHVHFNDIGKPSKFKDYLLKRALRIFPSYWIIFLMTIPILYLLKLPIPLFKDLILEFFLLPHCPSGVIPVGWTLKYEIIFYLLFSLLILLGRRIFFVGCFLLVLYKSNRFTGDLQEIYKGFWLIGYYFSPIYLLLFGIGMGISSISKHIELSRKISICFIFGPLIILIILIINLFFEVTNRSLSSIINPIFLYGIFCSFLILGLVGLEKKNDVFKNSVLLFLGEASYVLYLSHYMLLTILFSLFSELLNNPVNKIIVFIFSIIICLIFAAIFYLYIEKPILRFFKKPSTSS